METADTEGGGAGTARVFAYSLLHVLLLCLHLVQIGRRIEITLESRFVLGKKE